MNKMKWSKMGIKKQKQMPKKKKWLKAKIIETIWNKNISWKIPTKNNDTKHEKWKY